MGNPSSSITDGRSLEMFELSIQSSTRSYPISIGVAALDALRNKEFVVIADSKLDHISKLFSGRIIRVEASEANKNLATCESVIQQMKAHACNRDTMVVAIGGGFVQDIATLVSALYMRGISWIYVPTTLMAMMDSCIGGKSSINVADAKNLIGNFYPPMEILIDLAFVASLDEMAIASGLSEGVKICYAKGPSSFEKFCTYRKEIREYSGPLGVELVAHVLNAKKWFVETDEFDQGPRKLLNFGHTFGHALESASEFSVPHGIAVAVGVIAALNHPLSYHGAIEQKLQEECLSILTPIAKEIKGFLVNFDSLKFEKAFLGDKKHSAKNYRLVISQQGTLRLVDVERNDESLADIHTAIQSALAKVNQL
jgi:3-dehydroquinate synthase